MVPSKGRQVLLLTASAWCVFLHEHQFDKDTDSRVRRAVRNGPTPVTSNAGKRRGDQASGAVDMAQRLRILPVLPENSSSNPSTHTRQLTTVWNSRTKGSNTLFWRPQTQHTHRDTYKKVEQMFLKGRCQISVGRGDIVCFVLKGEENSSGL